MQQHLRGIMLRFGAHKYVINANIKEIFLQFPLQFISWKSNDYREI
jgi:hypothetical protein